MKLTDMSQMYLKKLPTLHKKRTSMKQKLLSQMERSLHINKLSKTKLKAKKQPMAALITQARDQR